MAQPQAGAGRQPTRDPGTRSPPDDIMNRTPDRPDGQTASRTRVCITIDTEFSIAGAFSDRSNHPVAEPLVWCHVDGRSEGLGFLLETFRQYRVQATFFVETLHRYHFRDDPMRPIALQIAGAGHEVQLHAHPCWAFFRQPDWWDAARRHRGPDDIGVRSVGEAAQLIEQGIATFREWGLPRPQVFRSGNLHHGDDLYRALAQTGIPYSSNIGVALYDSGDPNYRLYSGQHARHGVTELPVLSFSDWRMGPKRHMKLLTIAGSSFAETRHLLEQAHRAGMAQVVLLTHPFEYVQGRDAALRQVRRNRLVQARLRKLCQFLQQNSDRFEAVGLAAAAQALPADPSSANVLLRGTLRHALPRMATQVVHHRFGHWILTYHHGAGRPAMRQWIDSRYGTWRGLVRAGLAHLELVTGRLRPFTMQQPATVQRVVFVCLGNICRSAFAHHEALRQGLNVASLGLSTNTGAHSPAQAIEGAGRAGVDLTAHEATAWTDFKVRSGDLFLVMEVRQAHELRRRLGPRSDVQVALLGMWCSPVMPHLHDPHTLGDPYFDSCFGRVRQAVARLSAQLPNARSDALHDAGQARAG
jgi:protein-tyrosine-phosphatase